MVDNMKKMMMRDEGSALFIGIVMMLLLSALAGAYITVSMSNASNTASRKDSLQAYYVAEAGLEKAVADLNAGTLAIPAGGSTTINGTLDTYNFSAVVTDIGSSKFRVVSDAIVDGFERKMESVIGVEYPPFLQYGIITDGRLEIKGAVKVHGSIHSNYNSKTTPSISNSGVAFAVDKSISAVGSISLPAGNVGGDILPYSPAVPIPNIDLATIKEKAIAQGHYYSVSHDWSPPKGSKEGPQLSVNDVIFVEGDITLNSNTIIGAGVIACTGTMKINGNITSNPGDPKQIQSVMLISGGDTNFTGNPTIQKTLLYSKGRMRLGGNVTFTGVAIGRGGIGDDSDVVFGSMDLAYMPVASDLWRQWAQYKTTVRREVPIDYDE
jgi:hypothetical protein